MTYRDNVARAGAALQRGEDANWELARLTFENTYSVGESRDGRVPMEEWCTDVRAVSSRAFSVRTGTTYKAIWRAHTPLPIAELPSWSQALETIMGSTLDERRADMIVGSARNAEPETKREIFQELSRDADVVAEAAQPGSATSRAISDLEYKSETLRQEHRERVIQADPVARHLEEQAAVIDIAAECNRFRRDCRRFAEVIANLLRSAGDAGDGDLFWIREAITDARAALDQLDGFVNAGHTDLDVFLGSVLSGRRDA